MSDLYLEELVKRRKTGTDQALRYVLMALTAIGVVLSLLTWNLIIIAVSIAICVADIFIFPRFQTEWEYQYVNGELDVDRIINKAKRKRMASYDISKAELIAPAASHRFDYYNNNQKLKVCDYSSCNPEREKLVYAMVIPEKEGLLKVQTAPQSGRGRLWGNRRFLPHLSEAAYPPPASNFQKQAATHSKKDC